MYIDDVPPYGYKLPCGRVFWTTIKSVPDESSDKIHWFPCRRCNTAHAVQDGQLQLTYRPSSARAASTDIAILKDRVASDLRSSGGGLAYDVIADRHKVDRRTVLRVAEEIRLAYSPFFTPIETAQDRLGDESP